MPETIGETTKRQWLDVLTLGDESFAMAHQDQSDYWKDDGYDGAEKLKRVFTSFIQQYGSFEGWAARRKQCGLSTHVIDILGGAYFFDDLSNVDSITGVRLRDQDDFYSTTYRNTGNDDLSNKLDGLIKNPKRNIIEGNIFNLSTWRKINRRKFHDLIVFNSGGGLEYEFTHREVGVIRHLVRDFTRLYAGLSQEDGTMLIKFSTGMMPWANNFLSRLQENSGVIIHHDQGRHSCQIVKTAQAPKFLSFSSLGYRFS